MILGTYVREYDTLTGRHSWTPVTDETCWKCDRPHPDLAHAVYEYIVAVLGQELEQRIDREIEAHEAKHGCGKPGWFPWCPEIRHLYDLLPDYMQPVPIG